MNIKNKEEKIKFLSGVLKSINTELLTLDFFIEENRINELNTRADLIKGILLDLEELNNIKGVK